jgi:pimeloyl-ACP methyl ester carboxylesterase
MHQEVLHATAKPTTWKNQMTGPSGIHLTQWGHGGTKLVLIHGGVQGTKKSGTVHFSAQEPLALRGFEVIVPDRPGHGRSPAPGRPDDAEADGVWAADLLGDGAHLVGHSFGGCVALAAAALRPTAVKSLTLIEPAMQSVAIDRLPVLLFALRMVAILKLSFTAKQRVERFSKFMHIPDGMGGATRDRAEYEAMGKAASVLKVPKKATLERQLSQLARSGIPVLVVTGGWSAAVDATADVVARIANGTHMIIPSPHHFPHANSNDFNEILLKFISNEI